MPSNVGNHSTRNKVQHALYYHTKKLRSKMGDGKSVSVGDRAGRLWPIGAVLWDADKGCSCLRLLAPGRTRQRKARESKTILFEDQN
jgi:hypothetical protein